MCVCVCTWLLTEDALFLKMGVFLYSCVKKKSATPERLSLRSLTEVMDDGVPLHLTLTETHGPLSELQLSAAKDSQQD